MAVRTRRDYFGLELGIDTTPDRAGVAHGQPDHRLRRAAQQGGGRRQCIRPRVRHPPGWCAEGARHLRNHACRGCRLGGQRIVLGKLSGRNAFKQRLQELGITMDSEADVNAAFMRFKDLADRKSDIFDEDILALVSDESVTSQHEHYRLLGLAQHSESGERPHAKVTFAIGDAEFVADSDGNGPVDASLKAIESRVQFGCRAAAVLGECHHLREHRIAGRGDRAAATRRARGQRRRRRSRHRGGLGEGLHRRLEQASPQPRAGGCAGLRLRRAPPDSRDNNARQEFSNPFT